MRVHRLWLAGLAALFLPAVAAAQEEEGPQMFFVHQEVVKPSMSSAHRIQVATTQKPRIGSSIMP